MGKLLDFVNRHRVIEADLVDDNTMTYYDLKIIINLIKSAYCSSEHKVMLYIDEEPVGYVLDLVDIIKIELANELDPVKFKNKNITKDYTMEIDNVNKLKFWTIK